VRWGWLAGVLLLAPAWPALAQEAAQALYKCTDAKGGVSIQSQPCPRGSNEVWKRDTAPDPGPSAEALAARAALAQAEAERAAEAARLAELEQQQREQALAAEAAARAAEAAGRIPARKSECTLAHDFSDAAAAKPWLALTQAQREAIRRWVIEQCRDPDAPVAEETPPG
jgi:hypothetical protein